MKIQKKEDEISSSFFLSRRRDLDPRPRDYKSRALPLSYAGMQPLRLRVQKYNFFLFLQYFFLFFLIMRFYDIVEFRGYISE